MCYEIDFIGVSRDESFQDAGAVCFRWQDGNGNFKIGVYDAGFQAHGKEMVRYLSRNYFARIPRSIGHRNNAIDCLFVSHPHQDHVGGIQELLEHFTVKRLYMNRPWLYANELKRYYPTDGRSTLRSIEAELREDFAAINAIEEIAIAARIEICEAFVGDTIEEAWTVLSPDKWLYLDMIAESKKTDRVQRKYLGESVLAEKKERVVYEDFWTETLSAKAKTDAENETSIVLYGDMDSEGVLLVGDAGVEALGTAIGYAEQFGISLPRDVGFLEVPHHGGRHNVTPDILDRLVGKRLGRPSSPTKTAFVSVAEGSDHPRKVVVNALIRRGVEVYKTEGTTICHRSKGMPRGGMGYGKSLVPLEFSHEVEG